MLTNQAASRSAILNISFTFMPYLWPLFFTNPSFVSVLCSLRLFLCCLVLVLPSQDLIAQKNQSKDPKKKDTGKASFYHDDMHGHKTASGERYDKNEFTAAHKTLPFGTQLKVTNTNNGQSVIVTVNDRGPFAHRRLIDLSKAAARKIGLIGVGESIVKLEVLGKDANTANDDYKYSNYQEVQSAIATMNEDGSFGIDELPDIDEEAIKTWSEKKFYSPTGKVHWPKGSQIQLAVFEEIENLSATCKNLIASGYTKLGIKPLEQDGKRLYQLFFLGARNKKDAESKLAALKELGFTPILKKL